MNQNQEWSWIRHNAALDIRFLQAFYVHHAYPRHSHDYFVICVIERGFQSFTHRGAHYSTPPGGVIFINPGAVHTGEAADERGFQMRSLYPTISQIQAAASELSGRSQEPLFFKDVRVDDAWAREHIVRLHRSLAQGASQLEIESSFMWMIAELIKRYGDVRIAEQRVGREQEAIARARYYLDERYAESVSLTELANHVSLSPYYVLRAFRAQVGMPPHAYLESIRIRHAQERIEAGKALADVAAEVGFSSQSHLNRSFKRIIGVTPGQYAQRIG